MTGPPVLGPLHPTAPDHGDADGVSCTGTLRPQASRRELDLHLVQGLVSKAAGSHPERVENGRITYPAPC
ncbi:hypothetical protein [Streptomyces panaciradicis]|uniref:hypothetical protein n=1 Tax=Streptomyces panaciradicis TaxID=1470261 RepID=UPI00201CED09|nr:hypothetical protein [Streptomyces panaciradicis]MCL6670915.1 hypothetical protein [Streptomyces panaciradicis]